MLAVKIIPHERYPDMYRLQWDNGDVSTRSECLPPTWEPDTYGFYNKTRATELSKKPGIENYKFHKVYKHSKGIFPEVGRG